MVRADSKTVFRCFYEDVWNKGDLGVVDELLAADLVNHAVGDAPGSHHELYKRGVVETRLAYPDWTLVIEDLIGLVRAAVSAVDKRAWEGVCSWDRS